MEEPEIKQDQFGLENLNSLEELSMAGLTKFNLLKVFSSLTDPTRLKLAILGLEAWMWEELDEEYHSKTKEKETELVEKLGSTHRDDFVIEFNLYKLRLLSSMIRSKIPMEKNVKL
jgi:hypothetical protein